MRLELKTISVWSVVKIAFFFNLVGGLLYGLFAAVFMGSIVSLMSGSGVIPMDEFSESDFSVGALVVIMPIVSAASAVFFGTIVAVVLAVLYNLTSGILGGLEFEFQSTDQPETSSTAPGPAAAYTSVQQSPYQPPPVAVLSVPPPPPPPPGGPTEPPLPPPPPPANDSDSDDKPKPPPAF